MDNSLDGIYALSDESKYYRALYLEGKRGAEYINLPPEVEESARMEEKIVLSSGYYSRDDDSSVMILRHPNYMPLYLHSHRFAEVCCVLRGTVMENIEGKEYSLHEGDLLVLLPGFYHSIGVFDDETVAMNIILKGEFFAALDERFSLGTLGLSFALFSGLDIRNEIAELLRLQEDADMLSKLEMEVTAERIMLSIRRNGRLTAKGDAAKRNEVFRIMSYIEENMRDVTLSSFAADFGLSEQYASRLIHEKTGQLFSAIVRKLRMEEAARLLCKERLSVKEIAYHVGYSSPEQFSRTFRAVYSMSPREYRRHHSL